MGNDTHSLPQAAIDAISVRLAALPDLRLPAQLRSGASEQRKKEYLQALLLHDPGVFLERHGSSLSASERKLFHPLRGDYEVDFYLRLLEDGRDEKKRSQVSRNRRLAAMNRLLKEGTYFSEKEMRDRQPGTYHQYIGQYHPPEVPEVPGEGCQAGTLLAESIMRQQDELSMRQRAEEEARQWGRAETAAAAREQEEEEEESDSEDGSDQRRQQGPAQVGIDSTQQRQDERQQQQGTAGSQQVHEQQAGVGGGGRPHAGPDGAGSDRAGEEEGPSYVRISPDEQLENAAAFLDIMKQRFLAGQDEGVDYAAIDADAELDEDWAVEQGRDAEDAYFDDDA